jgi:hypothetical protein
MQALECAAQRRPQASTLPGWPNEGLPDWPLERYGLAARHLGQFNGRYLTGTPLPQHP